MRAFVLTLIAFLLVISAPHVQSFPMDIDGRVMVSQDLNNDGRISGDLELGA